MESEDLLKKIQKNQKTIQDLFDDGSLKFITSAKASSEPMWLIEPIYLKDSVSVGLARSGKITTEDYPEHIHPENHEYLIVVNGSILVSLKGVPIRTVNKGDCFSIPINTLHSTKPLEEGTAIISVSVPGHKGLEEYLK